MLLPTGYTHIHIRHRSPDPGVLMAVKNISIKIANARDLRPITARIGCGFFLLILHLYYNKIYTGIISKHAINGHNAIVILHNKVGIFTFFKKIKIGVHGELKQTCGYLLVSKIYSKTLVTIRYIYSQYYLYLYKLYIFIYDVT